MVSSQTEPRKRRKKSSIILFIIVAVVIIILAFVAFCYSPWANTNPTWYEPPVLKSVNGVLDVTLHAQKVMTNVGGKQMETEVYNGDYPSKTWEVKGGDIIKVHLQNDLAESTNLHFHGSHVSPKGNSDNVLLNIKPGENFEYEYHLPDNHPPGLYWYHPHYHPDVEDQVLGGMAGAIIVRGDVDELPGIKNVPERMLVFTTQFDDKDNSTVRLVNGQTHPMMYLRPGQTVRMRAVNASADDYYNLAIPGEKLHIISRDGNTLDSVQDVDNEVMAPGDRVEFLFTPDFQKEYDVMSDAFDQGFAKYRPVHFMHIKVQGVPMLPTPLPTKLIPFPDLRNANIDHTRTLTFSIAGTTNNPIYLFDGKVFNPDKVNQVMTLGTTEEWRLTNKSDEDHPFHIHINPFQVISVNGQPVDLHGYQDTFSIPKHSTVVIRTQYKDFDGKYVLHCHILFHEDNGMMQIVEVVKPGAQPASDNGVPLREGMPNMNMMQHMLQNAGLSPYKKSSASAQIKEGMHMNSVGY